MSRFWLVVAALLGGAVLEIAVLWWLADTIGAGWTLLVLVISAVVGVLLFRREGVRTFASLLQAPPEPDQIGQRVTDTFLVMLGGLLLLLPGLISDVLGLMCLVPFTRAIARRGVQALVGQLTRPYRDRADLIDLHLRPDTVVPGQTVSGESTGNGRGATAADDRTHRPRPDDPTVIRGEIEP